MRTKPLGPFFRTNKPTAKAREEIQIHLPQDRIIAGKAWETTPASIASTISKSLYERTVIAEVDGELWDLDDIDIDWYMMEKQTSQVERSVSIW